MPIEASFLTRPGKRSPSEHWGECKVVARMLDDLELSGGSIECGPALNRVDAWLRIVQKSFGFLVIQFLVSCGIQNRRP